MSRSKFIPTCQESWVSLDISKPRKLQFAFNKINDLASFNKIEDLASNLGATFHHVLRSANGFVDALAK